MKNKRTQLALGIAASMLMSGGALALPITLDQTFEIRRTRPLTSLVLRSRWTATTS